MKPSVRKPLIDLGDEQEPPRMSLRSVIRKSALLNVTVILTSFPVLVLAGGPRAILPALAVMIGISFIIWAATYAVFSFVSLARIFRILSSGDVRYHSARPRGQAGVADRWLDGPY